MQPGLEGLKNPPLIDFGVAYINPALLTLMLQVAGMYRMLAQVGTAATALTHLHGQKPSF